jgi:hypothetical protein
VTVRSAETRTSRFGGKLLQVASIGWGVKEEDARVCHGFPSGRNIFKNKIK